MRFWQRTAPRGAGRRGSVLLLTALGIGILMMLCGVSRNAGAQVIFSSETGHYYEALAGSLTWSAARDAARARTYLGRIGHLVTINSAAEQSFVTAAFPTAVSQHYWLGGYQDKSASDFSEPAGGWRWITGEPFRYTAWDSDEPNNNNSAGGSEDFLVFASDGRWNDAATATGVAAGYIVEYEYPNFPFDISGDGLADIVLQNSVTNQVSFWYMNGTAYVGGAFASLVPDAGYVLRGTADFNGDGHPDLIFQNTSTNKLAIWYMDGPAVIGADAISAVPAANYPLVAVGDFNGDGRPDLVFQNSSTGQIAFWYLNGATLIGYESLVAVPVSGYRVVGTGDFNGDGRTDLVFQNSSTGAVVFWYMNGAQFQSGSFASVAPLASFKVVGVSDYNNDGHPDLLFQNSANGQAALWYMNGPTKIGGDLINVAPGSNNVIVGPH